VGNPGFLPSVGELYQAAFKAAQRVGKPAYGYPKLESFTTTAYPVDDKAEIAKGLKDLAGELAASKIMGLQTR